jgi:Ni,Fe-hydrogenase maturation factor
MKKVYLVGNLLLKNDNQPLVLQKTLQRRFPDLEFLSVDPNENFIPENDSIIIDTVVGIKQVTLFTSVDNFVNSSKISSHDYDLGFHLKLLKKLKKIDKVMILGIPSSIKRQQTKNEIINQLNKIIST